MTCISGPTASGQELPPREDVGITTSVPQLAAELLHRQSRQTRAKKATGVRLYFPAPGASGFR